MSPRCRNRLQGLDHISRADDLLRDYDQLEEQLAASSTIARADFMKTAFSLTTDEFEISIESARTEIEKSESALANAAKVTFSAFSGERDLATIGSCTGLGLIHSGYNDDDDDDEEDGPVTTASFSCDFTGQDNLGKERTLSALSTPQGVDEEFNTRRAIETDADGFKKPLPPKRIQKSCESFLSFLDSPPSGEDFLTETENASGASSDHSTGPGNHCPLTRHGRGEELEDVQERERRLPDKDSCEILDLSLPKRR